MDGDSDAQIRANRWMQGCALPTPANKELNALLAEPLGINDVDVVVVVRQSCAILQGGPRVPRIDAVLARPATALSPDYIHGKSQYRLDLEIAVKGVPKPYTILANGLIHIPRELFARHAPCGQRTLDHATLETLRRWMGGRYTRLALPDAFEDTTKGVRSDIRNVVRGINAHLKYLFILLSPSGELALNEKYKVVLWLVMPDGLYSNPTLRKLVVEAGDKIAGKFRKCACISGITPEVKPVSKVTLSDLEEMARWDAFDDYSSRAPDGPQPTPLP